MTDSFLESSSSADHVTKPVLVFADYERSFTNLLDHLKSTTKQEAWLLEYLGRRIKDHRDKAADVGKLTSKLVAHLDRASALSHQSTVDGNW